jgi:hypothetical protein
MFFFCFFLSKDQSNANQFSSIEIILMGLEFLIPLMDQEMLKVSIDSIFIKEFQGSTFF